MKNSNKPELTLLKKGLSYKVMQVIGLAGMHMPEHHSTQEAVVMVQKGSAVLKMKDQEYVLQMDEPFIIPAGEKHSLYLKEDFQAVVVMTLESTIEF